jgi:hypothetical protein
VKGDALDCGGFFLKQDQDEAKRFYELSAKAGCPWASREEQYTHIFHNIGVTKPVSAIPPWRNTTQKIVAINL